MWSFWNVSCVQRPIQLGRVHDCLRRAFIAQHELNFGKAFSQQYVLSKEACFAVPSFVPHTLHNGWVLNVGRGLQVALATDGRAGISVAVLGLAVDAGRYIFVIAAPDFNRVYLDPTAMIPAVYNRKTGRVATTLYPAIDDRLLSVSIHGRKMRVQVAVRAWRSDIRPMPVSRLIITFILMRW